MGQILPHRGSKLEEIETSSIDELRGLQLLRLKKALRHAHDNVGIYRDKCRISGVHPDDLSQLSDLARFPFTEKADFRAGYPYGMFAVPLESVARIHASSGTTGKATVVGYTARDLDTWADLVARCLRAAGAKPGDKVHNAYNYGLFTGGLGSHYGAERLGCTVIPVSGGQTQRQAQLIADLDPDIIMVTPSYLLNIADEVDRLGIDPSRLSLRVALVGAEPWTEAMRTEINRRLGIRALDYYGISEIIGPGVAQECIETEDGPTLWEDHFYPEIVDPESGLAIPEGEIGELVLTCLTKEAIPVIRYRTRDLTALLPGTARPMRRLKRFTGRSDDMMIVRGVNVFPSQIEEQILTVPALAGHYVVELRRDGPLDTIAVRTEVRAGADAGDRQKLAADLARKIKLSLGISAEVSVGDAGTIERSQGKAARILDRRAL